METYIEVTWLLLLFITLSAHLLANALLYQVTNMPKIVVVSLISTTLSTLYYSSFVGLFLIKIIECICIYKSNIKASMQMLIIHLFYLSIGLVWTHGKIVWILLFVRDSNTSWIGFLIFLVFVNVVVKVIVTPKFVKNEYEMEFLLELNNHQQRCMGFIDTGNSLSYKKKPVLFLSNDYLKLTKDLEGQILHYKTVNKVSSCVVFPCKVLINKTWKKAYVSYSEHINKPIDCLLNPRLFY